MEEKTLSVKEIEEHIRTTKEANLDKLAITYTMILDYARPLEQEKAKNKELEEDIVWLNERHRDIHARKNKAQKVADEVIKANRWRDCKEELPEEDYCGKFIVRVLRDGKHFYTTANFMRGYFYHSDEDMLCDTNRINRPTHWKPITPPTDKEK